MESSPECSERRKCQIRSALIPITSIAQGELICIILGSQYLAASTCRSIWKSCCQKPDAGLDGLRSKQARHFLHSEILRRIGLFGAMSGAEILPVWDAWMSPDFTPWGSSTSKASPRRRWCQTPMPWKKSWFFFSPPRKLQPPTLNEAHTSWRD